MVKRTRLTGKSRSDNDRQVLQIRCSKADYQAAKGTLQLQDEQTKKCKRKNENVVDVVRKTDYICTYSVTD